MADAAEDDKVFYLIVTVALFAAIGGVYYWLYNTLQGRRVLRKFGVRTSVRGKAHAEAKGGFGASNDDKRIG